MNGERPNALMSTAEAAATLGMSEACVVRLIELGRLRATILGDEQRVGGEVVAAYLAKRRRRLDAVAAIRDADDAARLDYR